MISGGASKPVARAAAYSVRSPASATTTLAAADARARGACRSEAGWWTISGLVVLAVSP
jgi:hypothetical protein